MKCRYVARDHPRMVCATDHERGEVCAECEVCRGPHCRVCQLAHVEHTCPGCLADTRDNLAEIINRNPGMLTEATHHGVDGAAMVLLGPVANPEAWGHYEASALSGRIIPTDCDAHDIEGVQAWFDRAKGERHPVWVLPRWEDIYREAFDHDPATQTATLQDAADYLDQNLTYASTWPHVPFEDLARDLAACRAHVDGVLHDMERGIRANVDCFDCGGELERKLGKEGFDDSWTCLRCKRRYTTAEFNFALRAKLEESA